MKRILKAAFFCFMLLSIAAFWKHSTVKAAETLTKGKTYKIDLDGDGKKEKTCCDPLQRSALSAIMLAVSNEPCLPIVQ